jgi:predicted nucleic acid-binding protein
MINAGAFTTQVNFALSAEGTIMTSYMFDTNIFNHILDGKFEINEFRSKAHFYATHVQIDEIKNTSDIKRRQELLDIFEVIAGNNKIPTESFILGVSRLNEAKLGDKKKDLYSKIKTALDKRNRNKPNNIQDALIAETSMKNSLVLVTHDSDLFLVATKFNVACANIHKIMLELKSIAT